ncbi:hydrogenase expression/formation protein HypE [bacterium SM23_31]|nr:MAG: hydrogenase expression/formation protein HypE [bacterium SM23_31]
MASLDYIRLDHGSGGKLSYRLIKDLFLPHFANEPLKKLDDSAVLSLSHKKVAFTTDSYVVDPLFFPGGDIGKLAVCGTVNDIAMSGAVPVYISAGFIIEEGFPIYELERIIISMEKSAAEAVVDIVTGDTKVVPKGKADKLFINTAGIGIILDNVDISSANAQIGDTVILSGYIGDHGIAVMSKREGLSYKTEIVSDVAPLHAIIEGLMQSGIEIHSLRDPTRGGLASSLNEIAAKSNVGIMIEEEKIPVRKEVTSVCDLLGFDPLYVANEGKFIAVLPACHAPEALEIIKTHEYGKNAEIIGEVTEEHKKKVILNTEIGGKRIIDMLTGEQLPRIC